SALALFHADLGSAQRRGAAAAAGHRHQRAGRLAGASGRLLRRLGGGGMVRRPDAGGQAMSDSDDLTGRIERLEEVAAFQERTIDELSAALAEQWKQMQALKREIANLGAQLAEVEAANATPQREPPPPHY